MRAIMVTGGTRGLGAEVVEELEMRLEEREQQGFDPVAVIRLGSSPVEDRVYLSERVHDVVADLTADSFPNNPLVSVGEGLELYGLIHCAAINRIEHLADIDLESTEDIMRVNALAPYRLAQLFRHDLITTKGFIINVGSNACYGAGRDSLAYVASKHALTGVTRSLARDLGRQGVHTLQVNPGKIGGTDMSHYIERQQAALRASTPAEEESRQAESMPGGVALNVYDVSDFICNLALDRSFLQSINGSIIPLGC